MTRSRIIMIEATSVLFVLLLWYAITAWVVPGLGSTLAIFFPTPDNIAKVFLHDFTSFNFVTVVGPTLWRFTVGYTLSVVIGVGAGLLLGAVPLLLRALDPFIGFFRSLPGATLIPVVTLFLGLGDASKLVLIVSVAVWPILINTIDGVRRVDPTMRETAAAFQIGRWSAIRQILLPAAAPYILVGMRVAVSVGLVITILTELVGSSTGIGSYLVDAQASFALSRLWAALILLGLLGYMLNFVFMVAETHLLAWHRAAQAVAE